MIAELTDAAEAILRLGASAGQGTIRDQLEQVEAATGVRPPELDTPPIPACVEHVWSWWCEIASTRGSTGFGPMPIGYQEIAAWAHLTGCDPTPVEVAAMRAIEGVYLRVAGDEGEKKGART